MQIDRISLELYLQKACSYIDNHCVSMRSTDKANLTELGISFAEAKYIIKTLKPENYVSGPNQDHLVSEQQVFVFGYDYNEIELYIKLTIRILDDLFIMSFHEAKYKLEYPFKKS